MKSCRFFFATCVAVLVLVYVADNEVSGAPCLFLEDYLNRKLTSNTEEKTKITSSKSTSSETETIQTQKEKESVEETIDTIPKTKKLDKILADNLDYYYDYW